MVESYAPLTPARRVIAATRDIGGIAVIGYLIGNGTGDSFVASPKKTLESIAREHGGLVPLGIAYRLVTLGLSPYLVQRYLPMGERFEFMDGTLHPVAID